MRTVFSLILASVILSSCSNNKSSENKENDRLDQLEIKSTNDKVSYAIGFTSAGELAEFVDSPKYGMYFNSAAINEGFFTGIESLDTIQADGCDATLAEYFKNKGSFDTSKIRPAKASHCLGFLRAIEINYSLSKKGIFKSLSTDLMKKGFRDGLFHKDTLLPLNEQIQTISDYFGALVKKEGEDFLAKNKLRPEVNTSENGLQIETLKEGTGKNPSLKDSVSVYYTLTSVTGQVIESNMDQEKPVTFPVGGVIEGWKQGLQLMKKGGEYMLYVPYELGYGFQGSGNIRPYTALVFQIKLVNVK